MTKAFAVTQRARDLVADILEMSPYGIVRTGAENVRAGYSDSHAYVLLVARFEAETARQRDVLFDALDILQVAELKYRRLHDSRGDSSRAAGRAWDDMRRAGDRARRLLRGEAPHG